ncbi:MAG TPA: DNA polymerase III subunit beta [Candidatus Onthovivens sp.]|nr:DNA polymerase III subunit beta [Candidatus Onthovivens sp.]
MKFTINKEQFARGLNATSKVVSNKVTDPILSYLKLTLNDDGLNLIGSNGDISISTFIPKFLNDKEIIRDFKNGGILVDGKIITDITRSIIDSEISLVVEDEAQLLIENDKLNYQINVIREQEYRDIDFDKDGCKVVFKANEFVNVINEIYFAASNKETRPILTAVNFESENDKVIFTATDGIRLARKALVTSSDSHFNISVSAKLLLEVVKLISNEEEIELYINDKKALFVLNSTLISISLLSGEYPNTRNIIPKNFLYTLEVNANEFISTCSNISLLSIERENIVKLNAGSMEVKISSKSQQIGDAEGKLSLFRFEGEAFAISFNAEYVIAAIKALKSEDVIISFIGELKPFTITAKSNPDLIHLITPVRTY